MTESIKIVIDLLKWLNPKLYWDKLRQKPRIINLEQEIDKLKGKLAEQSGKERALVPNGFEYDSVKNIFYYKKFSMHICPFCWAEHGIKAPIKLQENAAFYWSCPKCKSNQENPNWHPPQIQSHDKDWY